MHLTAATFAYPHTDGAIRARLTERLRCGPIPSDVFVLATCLRIEVMAWGEHRLGEVTATVFGDPGPLDHGLVRVGEAAVSHIFRVAAGLESPILGEQEILTQFRQALAEAETGGLSGWAVKLLETAVSVGRKARLLLPDSPHASLGAVAAQLVGGADRVAVLGSGIMGQAVVAGLLGLPAPPEVTVVARHPERVTIPGITVWSMDRAHEALGSFPAVVSATSAKQRLIPDAELAAALEHRRDVLTLVDLAMPPDLAPPPGAPVRYFDIDDLAAMAGRRARSQDADTMVDAAAAEAYRHFSDREAVGPVIGELMRTADDIVDRAVDRFAGRLGQGDDGRLLRQTAHTVARTLLASPVSYLRSSDRPAEAVDLLAEVFGIERP